MIVYRSLCYTLYNCIHVQVKWYSTEADCFKGIALLSLFYFGVKCVNVGKLCCLSRFKIENFFAGGEKVICSCWIFHSFHASCDRSLLVVPKRWSLLSLVHGSTKSNTPVLECYIHHHCEWYTYSLLLHLFYPWFDEFAHQVKRTF